MARKRLPGARGRATRMAAKRTGRDFGRRLIGRLGFGMGDFKEGGFFRKKLGLYGESFLSGDAGDTGAGPAPSITQPQRVTNESNPSIITIVDQLDQLVKAANKVGVLTKEQQEAMLGQLSESRRVSKEQLQEGGRGAPIPVPVGMDTGNSLAPLGDIIDDLRKQIDKLTNTVQEKVDDQEYDSNKRGFLERMADRMGAGEEYRSRRDAFRIRRDARQQREARREARVGDGSAPLDDHVELYRERERYRDPLDDHVELYRERERSRRRDRFSITRAFKKWNTLSPKEIRRKEAEKRLARIRAAKGGILGRMFGRGAAVTGAAVSALSSTKIGKIIGAGASRAATGLSAGGTAVTAAIRKAAGPIIARGLGGAALKSIPILGTIAGVGFAINRLVKGDVVGAGLDLASGVGGIFAAIPALIASTARDVYKSVFGVHPEGDPEFGPRMAMVTRAVEALVAEQLRRTVKPKNRPTQTDTSGGGTTTQAPQAPPQRVAGPSLSAAPASAPATAPASTSSTSTAGESSAVTNSGSPASVSSSPAAPPPSSTDAATRVDPSPTNSGVEVLQASQSPPPISIQSMYGYNQQLGRFTPQSTPTTKGGHVGIGNVPNPDYIPTGTNNLPALFNVMFFNVNYQEL